MPQMALPAMQSALKQYEPIVVWVDCTYSITFQQKFNLHLTVMRMTSVKLIPLKSSSSFAGFKLRKGNAGETR